MIYPTNYDITYTALAATEGLPNDTFSYAWTFDDNTVGAGNTLSKSWATDGNHLATVLATDNQTGGVGTDNKTITTSSPSGILHTLGVFAVTIAKNTGLVTLWDANWPNEYQSFNYGITWVETNPSFYPVSYNIRDISCSYDGHYMAFADYIFPGSAGIYVSSDYGATWGITIPGQFWGSVCVSSDGSTMIAGSLDFPTKIMRSTDFGATWSEIASSIPDNYNALGMSADGAFIVGAGGMNINSSSPTLAVSNDYGSTWTSLIFASELNLFQHISVSETGQYMLAISDLLGQQALYLSNDFGVTWNQKSLGSAGNGQCWIADMSKDGRYMYVSLTGATPLGSILRSNDFGQTWSYGPILEVSGIGLISIACSGDGALVVTGNGNPAAGSIKVSNDYGVTFQER